MIERPLWPLSDFRGDNSRALRMVRYRGVSMSQQPFVEMPPREAAFFLPGVRCAAAPRRGERRIEGEAG